jgi:hypothetical protein
MAAETPLFVASLDVGDHERVSQVPEYGSNLHPAVPCQCAIAVFILRDRDGVLRGGRTNVVFHVDLSAEASSRPPQIGGSAHADPNGSPGARCDCS